MGESSKGTSAFKNKILEEVEVTTSACLRYPVTGVVSYALTYIFVRNIDSMVHLERLWYVNLILDYLLGTLFWNINYMQYF